MDSFLALSSNIAFAKPKAEEKREQPTEKVRCGLYGPDADTMDFKQPMPFKEFADFGLPKTILRNLKERVLPTSSFQPTTVQKFCGPLFLEDYNILGVAKTGCGKTLAYLLPLFSAYCKSKKSKNDLGQVSAPFSIVVAPTTELSIQIYSVVMRLCPGKWKTILLNSTSPRCNFTGTSHSVIIVGTPLRILSEIEAKKINLENIRILVLDEVDKLLDLGLREQAESIMDACKCKTAMFSATLNSNIERLITLKHLTARLIVGTLNFAADTVTQKLIFTNSDANKLITLKMHLQNGTLCPPVIVFVQSIERANQLYNELLMATEKNAYMTTVSVGVVHSKRLDREETINDFRIGKIIVLIATDVLARGLDLVANTVVNFDFPNSTETYIHRIGRTGRAGRQGLALTYFTTQDALYLKSVVSVIKQSNGSVPDWMALLKKPSKEVRRKMKRSTPRRSKITSAGYV